MVFGTVVEAGPSRYWTQPHLPLTPWFLEFNGILGGGEPYPPATARHIILRHPPCTPTFVEFNGILRRGVLEHCILRPASLGEDVVMAINELGSRGGAPRAWMVIVDAGEITVGRCKLTLVDFGWTALGGNA